MDMDGYYDHNALVTLDRHLALAGLVTEDTRRVGHQASSLTGLPFIDLERLMEHLGGMSSREMVAFRGLEYYRELEEQALARALADRPYGILVLGDGTLLDNRSRRRVLKETTLVALERDLPQCFQRFQALQQMFQERDPESYSWHPLFQEPLSYVQQIQSFYEERRPTLTKAAHKIPLHDRKLKQAVEQVLDLLIVRN